MLLGDDNNPVLLLSVKGFITVLSLVADSTFVILDLVFIWQTYQDCPNHSPRATLRIPQKEDG